MTPADKRIADTDRMAVRDASKPKTNQVATIYGLFIKTDGHEWIAGTTTSKEQAKSVLKQWRKTASRSGFTMKLWFKTLPVHSYPFTVVKDGVFNTYRVTKPVPNSALKNLKIKPYWLLQTKVVQKRIKKMRKVSLIYGSISMFDCDYIPHTNRLHEPQIEISLDLQGLERFLTFCDQWAAYYDKLKRPVNLDKSQLPKPRKPRARAIRK